MARIRLSGPAQRDLDGILAASLERWGAEGRRRYASLHARAIRMIAAAPESTLTRDRGDVRGGIRSLHLRHARGARRGTGVAAPVHVVFYRRGDGGVLEVVRILHDRMDVDTRIAPARRRR